MKKSLLTLVPTPLHPSLPLNSESLRRLQDVVLNTSPSEDVIIVQEEAKVARSRWISWGLPREWINSFHYLNEHNAKEMTVLLGKLLLEDSDKKDGGKQIFLMSDGGLPVINDPGRELVDFCHRHKIRVTSFPFENSALLALALSGFICDRFLFEGFLPRVDEERITRLRQIQKQPTKLATILMDTPYRLQKLLGELKEIGLERSIFLALNLGFPEESEEQELLLRGPVDFVISKLAASGIKKGEFILIIAGEEKR